MKKIVCLLLALVFILSLAGCRVSNRPYRRFSAPYGTENRVTDTTTNRTYRSPRTNTVNPYDAQLNDGVVAPGNTALPRTAVSPLPTTVPNKTNRPFNIPS